MDINLPDGRTLRVRDSGSEGLPVFWLHGSPGTGDPLPPLLAVQGVRLLSYDRPGYGGSTRQPGRDITAAVTDVTAAANALG
ncbi:MAG: alpha/beta hydrolase, partial [Umezawaea sp.]